MFFAEGDHLRRAFGLSCRGTDRRHSGYVHKMATQMRNVARHHLKLDRADPSTPSRRWSTGSRRRTAVSMGQRNRTRLAQFDDAAGRPAPAALP